MHNRRILDLGQRRRAGRWSPRRCLVLGAAFCVGAGLAIAGAIGLVLQ